jgi:hypothetical protein
MDKKEIEKRISENKECDLISSRAILKILENAWEDWETGIIESNEKEIKIHSDTTTASAKKINIDSFLSKLNKEQTDIFINLLLAETKQFIGLFPLDELKKLKI